MWTETKTDARKGSFMTSVNQVHLHLKRSSLRVPGRISALSAMKVVSWTTLAVTGNGESGFDSGE